MTNILLDIFHLMNYATTIPSTMGGGKSVAFKPIKQWEAEIARNNRIAQVLVDACKKEGGVTMVDFEEIIKRARYLIVIT